MSLSVCDSLDVVNQPKNCTSDKLDKSYSSTKEILYTPRFGFTIQGTGYYAGAAKQVNYFDTYFASNFAANTQNPIATAAYMRVSNTTAAAFFVLNYREPSNDQGAPQQAGVIYQESGSVNATTVELNHASSAGTVYTISSDLHTKCGAVSSIEYAFFVVDSKGNTYRYPENANLEVCAGTSAGDLDIVADATGTLFPPVICLHYSLSAAGVEAGAVVFKGSSNAPPTTPRTDLKPIVSVTGGGNAAALLPALFLILAAFFAVSM